MREYLYTAIVCVLLFQSQFTDNSGNLLGQGKAGVTDRPNIIFIMTDDHTKQAMSVYVIHQLYHSFYLRRKLTLYQQPTGCFDGQILDELN